MCLKVGRMEDGEAPGVQSLTVSLTDEADASCPRRKRGRLASSPAQECVVLVLRSFAPLATLYTLYRIAVAVVHGFFPLSAPTHPPMPTLPLALEVFIYLETAFLAYMMWRSRVLARRRHSPHIGRDEIDLLVRRMIAHTKDMKELISGWFHDVPFDDLSREDIWTFVAWMLYSKYPEEVEGPEREAVSWAVCSIERSIGHAIPPSQPQDGTPHRASQASQASQNGAQAGPLRHVPMRHTLDPLQSKHRPLLAYLISHWLLNSLAAAWLLRRLGFRRRSAGPISYWHRPSPFARDLREGEAAGCLRMSGQRGAGGQGQEEEMLPLVFVHGIGMGLFTYYHMLKQLTCALPCALFLIELPHASLKICEDVPSDREAVQALLLMLENHGHRRAVFSGHSLGSVYLSWMCRLAPQAVAASVFIEPIVFMLYLKTVTSTFLYHDYGGIVGYAIRSELFLNHALRRHFWWFKNVLWIEDVTHPCHVFLCAADEVVPSAEVVRYIRSHDEGHHLTTEVMDTDWHGAWLFNEGRVAHIVSRLRSYWAALDKEGWDSERGIELTKEEGGEGKAGTAEEEEEELRIASVA